MKEALYITRTTRNNFIKVVDSLKLDKICEVPKGFNNNIIWNFGHVVATQNLIVYKLSSLPFTIDESFIDRYRKGTKPEPLQNAADELSLIKEYAFSTLEQLEKDIAQNKFKTFIPYETSFNIKLTSASEAINFNNVHEGLHLGYAMAIRKALG